MVSQLMKVPVILKGATLEASDLELLGEVKRSKEGWVVDYITRVCYFGDDETFIYVFWNDVAGKNIAVTIDDLIRFEWGEAEKVRTPLP